MSWKWKLMQSHKFNYYYSTLRLAFADEPKKSKTKIEYKHLNGTKTYS
jgi:hypothetical protein